MHYCQRCDVAVPLQPAGGIAVCPACGASEPARRLPLFVVTGASGSGKTAVYPHLVAELPECVVFDTDWLIDSLAPATSGWPALRDAWLAVAHGIAQSGPHTVLLGPFTPEQLADLPTRQWIGTIHFALLDCPDDMRRARLAARPPWRGRNVEEHVRFAAYLRATISTVITTDGNPAETAARLAAWVRVRLTAS